MFGECAPYYNTQIIQLIYRTIEEMFFLVRLTLDGETKNATNSAVDISVSAGIIKGMYPVSPNRKRSDHLSASATLIYAAEHQIYGDLFHGS
ncbi:hypothetical protein GWI33_001368 [Rhynchophorus ferrugineus]|uniref:Uncharacterized protein n=1 Tax=Rhynchophorus ferrugineus TaxID=354439 RepID=A0A834INH3_RHYFE|nr:hypothetical protein GWI33_001368 [Rhynchophorus ferrugineus]